MKKMKFQWKLETRFGHVDVKGQFYIQLFQLSQKSSGLGSVASCSSGELSGIIVAGDRLHYG